MISSTQNQEISVNNFTNYLKSFCFPLSHNSVESVQINFPIIVSAFIGFDSFSPIRQMLRSGAAKVASVHSLNHFCLLDNSNRMTTLLRNRVLC